MSTAVQPDRVSSASGASCPHAPNCVGCPLYGSPYGEQLRRKQEIVERELAERAPSLDQPVHRIVGAQFPFGYRNQVKLVVRRARRGLLFGVYRPGTHQVVDVSRCPVHDEYVERALATIHRVVDELAAPIYDERSGSGWLRYVFVRSSRWRKSTLVTLVVRRRDWPGERALVERLGRSRGIGGVVFNVNESRGNAVLGDKYVAAFGQPMLVERLGDLEIECHPASFVQANVRAARRAYDTVVSFADPRPDETVIDLFSGIGALSFLLAARARTVLGVESVPRAILDAKANSRRNGASNVRFFAGDAGEVLPGLAERLDRVDVVTLNPPRKGANAETLAAIAAARPRRVVYMSCDPKTLARDIEILAGYGYRTGEIQPFDFLPQTEHVECVARIDRAAD